ncbi:uncharacterized protein RCC_10909 [Ramularia collo-cygni]|uniref:F-box domain-containing protein n=1 Tax=Ramularia collo-cygni TaxID=112498 RepID=A0A2D3VDL4_9PEZI|nr:uncharacterized protein RCC_10909 [Ramularia collo-cygni]CZT25180.1 uncharacterized protein RCC_10909 [Ramularia collo-cygni]
MAPITAIPNELLILVFTHCPDIFTAAKLSQASKALRNVWLENVEVITREILEPEIPAYDDAMELARYESGKEASFVQRIPRLLRNAEMARSVAKLWAADVQDSPYEAEEDSESATPTPTSYYTIRRLAQSHGDKELQRTMSSIMDAASRTEAWMNYQLCCFMCMFMKDDEQIRHGILKDESLLTWYEKEEGGVITDEWDFASTVAELVMREKQFPRYSSALDPCPWSFGHVCCGRDCRRGETWPGNTRPASE